VLFETLKLPVIRRTKTGYSTDEEVLRQLADQHPLPLRVIEYRELQKLKSTYIDGLLAAVDRTTGRVHTTFNQAVTATGRLSSSNPNLQNIPIRSEYGRQIRRAFIAPAGSILVSGDYSQIDLRVLAHVSGDAALVRSFVAGEDIHAATAREVFRCPPDMPVPAEQRRMAKAINFGIVYGISPYGLAQQLKIPNDEAGAYIKQYFAKYPGVAAWIESIVQEARTQGSVTTLFGRRRYLPEINAKNAQMRNFAERTAMNTPIQGTAADIIKIAMITLDRALRERGFSARLLVQVHDELVFEVPREEAGVLAPFIREHMEQAAQLRVPLVVDMKAGPHWAALQPLALARGVAGLHA
jgi:DNA polymerase-1